MNPPKAVFFFDIDNCLYPKSARVHDYMADLIHAYFEKHLGLSNEEAVSLQKEYYSTFGLAIKGLVVKHQIDPLDFNNEVDDKVPLDKLIQPRHEVRHLLKDMSRNQVKLWLFTNAYKTHANRVIRIMGLEGLFDTLTYCDYLSTPLLCEPAEGFYAKAMSEAGIDRMEDCYFVDDSRNNYIAGEALGWNGVHLVEGEVLVSEKQACAYRISHLEELRVLFPQFFQSS